MMSWGRTAIMDYDGWLGSLPHKHKIVVGGNHDRWMEDPVLRRFLTNATVLIDEPIEVLGLRIWGSGITSLAGEAFGIGSPAQRAKLYATIPDDVNILITHTPPYGILDRSPGSPHHSGCPELRAAVERIRPQLHAFGHIHGAHGMQSNEHTVFINASMLGPDGDIAEQPIVLQDAEAVILTHGSAVKAPILGTDRVEHGLEAPHG